MHDQGKTFGACRSTRPGKIRRDVTALAGEFHRYAALGGKGLAGELEHWRLLYHGMFPALCAGLCHRQQKKEQDGQKNWHGEISYSLILSDYLRSFAAS